MIRMVFELADRGCGGTAIARALNEKGLVRRNGKAWTQRQVAAALKLARRRARSDAGCWRGA
jgi:hypothetical protein